MIENEFLERLRCMHTGSSLTIASGDLIQQVNDAIVARQLRDHLGRPVEQKIEAGLVNEQCSSFYPIVNGVVQMLENETIDLSKIKQT